MATSVGLHAQVPGVLMGFELVHAAGGGIGEECEQPGRPVVEPGRRFCCGVVGEQDVDLVDEGLEQQPDLGELVLF
jgi:hypothetical protein